MGRLLKKKVDQIASLRKQGYTQKEVAQKLEVHVRTVRKYDPTHTTVKRHPIDNDAIESIRRVLPTILDWLDILVYLLLSDDKHNCPRCHTNALEFDLDEVVFICRKCGYRPVLPHDICRSCFALDKLEFDKESRIRVCQECGARQR